MMLNSQYTCIHINFYTHMSTLFVTVTLIFYIVIKLLKKVCHLYDRGQMDRTSGYDRKTIRFDLV